MAATDLAINIRAASYFLATTTRRCWRCSAETRVHGFMLPEGHEVLALDEDDASLDCWERADEPSLLSRLEFLAPPVVARVRMHAPHYQLRFSSTTGAHYWMNGCEHCAAKLGDAHTFDEPGEGFLVCTPEQARRITLSRVLEPFAAFCATWSFGIEGFELMRRV